MHMQISPEVAGSLWLIFLGGLAGSVHCLGMCGPLIVLAESMRSKNWKVWSQISLHIGRLITYSVMGIIAGFFGAALKKTGVAVGIQGGASIVGGLLMIVFGLSMIGWIKIKLFDTAGSGKLNTFIANKIDYSSFWGGIVLGMYWGLLPCGLVWAYLLGAATAAGDPFGGMLTMATFGAGTVPALLILGGIVGLIGHKLKDRLNSISAIIVILMGVFLILRGMKAAGWIGKVMLAPGVPLY